MPIRGFRRILAGMTVVFVLTVSVGEAQQPKLVKVDATATKIDADGKQTVTVTLDIEKNWYVFANPIMNEDLKTEQTVLRVASDVKLAALEVKYPAGKLDRSDPVLSFMYYEGKVSIQASVQRAPGDNSPLKVEVWFRPMNNRLGVCVKPQMVKITLP